MLTLDMNEQRLEIAKEMGADSTVLITSSETPEQIANRVIQTIGAAPHATIDCAGFESTITVGILVR